MRERSSDAMYRLDPLKKTDLFYQILEASETSRWHTFKAAILTLAGDPLCKYEEPDGGWTADEAEFLMQVLKLQEVRP